MRKAAKKVLRRVEETSDEWQPATPDPVALGESAPAFQKDGTKRARLMAILRDPVFREAVAILEDELKPRDNLALFMEKPEVAAARYHLFAGMTYLTDGFKRLITIPQERRTLTPKRLTTELPPKPNP